ncbi:glycoside hydrolase superfamily [Halteromyces radiatus]|uniref:glycoside hydrolase superfamily n=1 Tax=Halteromyces radiatus TaxID=101107 RepID=UPI00221E3CE6|nr:glycoside hydrolase superfamily [Halteromyces radiatus]KAI8097667.1 glycoside hydrolase superfamily [Halteromyces radiatus]
MGDMTQLYSLFSLVVPVVIGFVLYTHHRTHGTLTDITTESVAYNRTKYQSLLDWDKYSLRVEGEPILILSAEFHYWRIPDRERWPHILQQYQTAGYNTIRIYFHWGYHSPAEGLYLFDGNRDVDYLLTLCEKLGLFVLAAPGPYICAETQGGGYPSWLVAKRHLNIRHNSIMLWRTYDASFVTYEIQWLDHILPILARHQITENNDQRRRRGCILALQIDNELFETMAHILPVGLRDQMRVLAKAARDANITVPLFTNDGFEEGGWVPGKKPNFWSKYPFGIDLYGFDKYVVFAPSSSPKSWLIDGGTTSGEWKDWDPKRMENSMDRLEKTVRGFGGGAKESPIFIPELQGGWFNHYQLQHTYDQIYDFYGDQYTKLLFESSLAQGVTMASLYMVYGGTNWGTLGDPDVYTSYDYSACIREYGYLSSRGRNLRQTLIFAQSFEPYFTRTDLLKKPTMGSPVREIINRQRVAVGADQDVVFTFFRNFDRKKRDEHVINQNYAGKTIQMKIQFGYKTSFIGIGNYKTINGLSLLQAIIPIHARMVNPDTKEEIWIVESTPSGLGELAFENVGMTITGNMQPEVVTVEESVSLIRFKRSDGWTKLAINGEGALYIIGLESNNISTLYADFQPSYWNRGSTKSRYPGLLAWGADHLYYNQENQELEVGYNIHDTEVHLLSFTKPIDQHMIVHDQMPYLYTKKLADRSLEQHSVVLPLINWKYRDVNWNTLNWQPLKRNEKNKLVWDAIDYHFTSGHVLYRNQFKTPGQADPHVQLSLNVRHRATVVVNGHIVGGHTTYSRQLFSAGAKIGPDPWFIGTHNYDLTPYLTHEGRQLENTLVIIVDSFGLNRQAFIMNDIRNPRGIIKAKLKGVDISHQQVEQGWQITGVDVGKLSQAYNTTGFPDEQYEVGYESFTPGMDSTPPSPTVTPITHTNEQQQQQQQEEEKYDYRMPMNPSQGVRWLQFNFDNAWKQENQRVPLRLHLDGEFTAKVILNDLLIGLYFGNGDGPQHDFYLPDELIQRHDNVVRMLVYCWTPTEAQIRIQGWHVKVPGSGNLITSSSLDSITQPAMDYIVWKDTVRIQ